MNAINTPRALQRPSLRPYQLQAVEAVCKSLETNDTTLLVMCTGGGKTQIASSIAERFLDKGKILFLAHRKELVQQGADRLHLVTGEQVDIEMAELWASNRSKVVSASLDSMRTRLERWAPDHFSLVIFDECFPAGTLIDGRPIETIRLGDEVLSVDHDDGMVKPRPVVRIFKKLCSSLVKLRYGASEVTCTGNHPVFVKGRGYVEAKSLSRGDLLCVRDGVPLHQGAATKDLLSRVPLEALIGSYGAHEQVTRLSSHENKQPYASRGQQGTSHGNPSSYGTPPACPSGEWARCYGGGSSNLLGSGLANERRGQDWDASRQWIPHELQDRRWERRDEGGDRGGRAKPSSSSSSGSGPEEGGLLTWVRLDHLESVEPTSPGGDWVYNLEIEGSHTYFANDLLVHNCHHSIAKSYRKVLDHFTCKKMGMTATPDRGDEKALGQVWGDVAFVYDIVQGIEDGYLVPIVGRSVRVDEVNLSGISKTAGDLAAGELDEEIASHIEGIVSKTLEIEPNRTGIWFFPGVKSAELACDRLNALGQSAAFVSGMTPKEERDDIMKGFKNGTFKHLTNCQVATEGFDAPNADMVVIGRPTLSRALYAQMVGRGLRVLPGLVDGVGNSEDSSARRSLIACSTKPSCAVIDFAGNAGKHTLITPEDLLGGDYSDEEVKLAKKAAKEGVDGDVLAGLEAARRELKAMMAKLQSKVKATVQSFNPFQVLAMPDPDPSKEAYREPMSPEQSARLKGHNVKEAQMRGLSKLEAQKLLGALETRRRLGLCTLNQLNTLKKFVNTPTNLPGRQASKALTFLAENCGWNPSVDQRATLQEMVSRK